MFSKMLAILERFFQIFDQFLGNTTKNKNFTYFAEEILIIIM